MSSEDVENWGGGITKAEKQKGKNVYVSTDMHMRACCKWCVLCVCILGLNKEKVVVWL